MKIKNVPELSFADRLSYYFNNPVLFGQCKELSDVSGALSYFIYVFPMGTSERSIHLLEIYKIYENFAEKILETVTHKSTEDVYVNQYLHFNILLILE